MILRDIINILEKKFPTKNAENWDNVGLMIGDRRKEIKKIQISLDCTIMAIDKAIKNGVDLILTHHPIIFRGIKKINSDDVLGRKIIKLIQNDIAVYSMHTNLDATKFGLNDLVAEKLGAENFKIIEKIETDIESGIGREFRLKKEVNLRDYIVFIKEEFNISNLRVISENIDKPIKKIAVVNGSGMSYWRDAKKLKVDLFITGDVSYHDALDAKESGLSVIDMGHFESEICFSKIILEELKDLQIETEIFNDGPIIENY